jgi:hypothetical protein
MRAIAPTLAGLGREDIPQMNYFGTFLTNFSQYIIWTLYVSSLPSPASRARMMA